MKKESSFYKKLKQKHAETKRDFYRKFKAARKIADENNIDFGKIREHSAKILGSGLLTGTLLLSPPPNLSALPSSHEIIKSKVDAILPVLSHRMTLVESLKKLLPQKPRPLSRDEEKALEMVIRDQTSIPVKASLEGEHLNTTYGYVGLEQHLVRYPGDSVSQHGSGGLEDSRVLAAGMAPGKGAWGYFVGSKSEMSSYIEDVEKWYTAVPTMYLPDWQARLRYLHDWYKYRKVLMINTLNGHAVVGAIADTGPAAWTGKQFGASPEIMHYLGGPRYTKGAVLLFFVDDPENQIPLGPVEYNDI